MGAYVEDMEHEWNEIQSSHQHYRDSIAGPAGDTDSGFEGRMSALRLRPGAAVYNAGTDHAGAQKRWTMSKAGRARVAAAQKARWAAQKQQQAQPEKPKKRKFSAAGLRAIREATKKRWAAYRKARKAAA